MKDKTLIAETAEQMLAAGMSLHQSAEAIKREMIVAALHRRQGNLCRVARLLGEHRNTVARQMEKLGIAHVPQACREEARGEGFLPLKPVKQNGRHSAFARVA